MLEFEDFQKLQLQVGKIVEAALHPNAEKLYLLKVDIGEKTLQLVAGIRQFYGTEELIGKRVVVVANLAPRTIRGVLSEGMVLAAHDAQSLSLVVVEREIAAGGTVK